MESICNGFSFLRELEGSIIRNEKESSYKTAKHLDIYFRQ